MQEKSKAMANLVSDLKTKVDHIKLGEFNCSISSKLLLIVRCIAGWCVMLTFVVVTADRNTREFLTPPQCRFSLPS